MSKKRFTPPFKVTARLKPASGPGVISSFFTYTDPLNGTPHFENDFEFPGNNFKRDGVWTTHYNPSVPLPVTGDFAFIKLDFDPAHTFAEYTLEVYEDATIWKVNGTAIRKVIQSIPPKPQAVMLNIWFKGQWKGLYDFARYNPKGSDYLIDWIEVASIEKSL